MTDSLPTNKKVVSLFIYIYHKVGLGELNKKQVATRVTTG